MKVLIVEDDELVLAFIANTLVEHGQDFDVARSGTWGLAAADAGDHDVIVLDLNLPDITGFEVAERHRERGNQTPILMLTARSAESGVIRGLNVGADDYVTKPCKRGELLAWLRALARRRSPTGNAMLQYDDLDVDRINNRVR
jgi:DNA-binding response OmpR family regulator